MRSIDGEVLFWIYRFPGNTLCGAMYEPLRRISKWQWLPEERPVLPLSLIHISEPTRP